MLRRLTLKLGRVSRLVRLPALASRGAQVVLFFPARARVTTNSWEHIIEDYKPASKLVYGNQVIPNNTYDNGETTSLFVLAE